MPAWRVPLVISVLMLGACAAGRLSPLPIPGETGTAPAPMASADAPTAPVFCDHVRDAAACRQAQRHPSSEPGSP